MPWQQPLASPVPIGTPQCCLWTGSERYGFRCRRLQEQVPQNSVMQTG